MAKPKTPNLETVVAATRFAMPHGGAETLIDDVFDTLALPEEDMQPDNPKEETE